MIIPLAIIGLGISAYALYVKQRLKKDKKYKPACDINKKISCSHVLNSPYANLFYLPNALVGIVLYAIIILAALLRLDTFILVLSSIAAMVSLILGYLLLKLKKTCLVCIASYLVNIGLFIASLP